MKIFVLNVLKEFATSVILKVGKSIIYINVNQFVMMVLLLELSNVTIITWSHMMGVLSVSSSVISNVFNVFKEFVRIVIMVTILIFNNVQVTVGMVRRWKQRNVMIIIWMIMMDARKNAKLKKIGNVLLKSKQLVIVMNLKCHYFY